LHHLVAKVWRFVQQERLLGNNEKLVLAVSGGADSTAMLHMFYVLSQKLWTGGEILVGHLDHMLRGAESEEDAEFVRRFCEKLEVKSVIESIDVKAIAETAGLNLESAARRARYDYLRRVAVENDATRVATAHTMNDQAETLLLRLIRGSGTAGLGSIPPVRPLNPENNRNRTDPVLLIRPLLCLSREEVLDYCRENELEYRTDSSNFLADYARNRVRHRLTPELAKLNPQIVSVLSSTADRLRIDEEFLQNEAVERMKNLLLQNGSLIVSAGSLTEAPVAVRRRMIREAIAMVRGGLNKVTMRHIAAVESLLENGKSGKEVAIPGLRIHRQFDSVIFAKIPADPEKLKPTGDYLHKLGADGEVRIGLNNRELIINIDRTEKYVWENRSKFTALLDGKRTELPLVIRPRRIGDRYVPVGANNPVKLKELMIKNRIPLNERNTYPVLVTDGGDLVWSPGLPIAKQFAATTDTSDWLVITARFEVA